MKDHLENNRRQFIKNMGLTMGSTLLSVPVLSSFASGLPSALDKAISQKDGKKAGIALVGLGGYSTGQLAPALQETKNCYLAGIVTGTPEKEKEWKEKYDIPDKNVYNYENFEEIANNDDIDIIYVVLPNSMHAEYVIRAAKTKKNIICEKPIATNVEDAEKMLGACRENGVKLAIGYRLHFEPFNKRVMELGQKRLFGDVKEVKANFSEDMTSGKPNVWRLNKEMAGGGPLMEFDDGFVAECESSYGEKNNKLYGKAERGWWELSPAYSYDGKKGETMEGPMDFENVYEQANQMDSQASHFSEGKESIVPGDMGLRDLKILMAIYESADAGGKRVAIT